MAQPNVVEAPGEDAVEEAAADAVSDDADAEEPTAQDALDAAQEAQSDDPGDVEEATVDLSEDDLDGGGGGDLFDDVEESERLAPDDGDDQDGGEETDDGDDAGDGLGDNAESMEAAVNQGAARLAVIGLQDDDFEESNYDKESLKDEFEETFEAFRLGYFGSQWVDEYVIAPADGDVDPTWGLLGSALIATAMVVTLRPDGDDAVGRAREALGGLSGGGA